MYEILSNWMQKNAAKKDENPHSIAKSSIWAEIGSLLKDGQIEKINEIIDDVFFQPTVITV